MGIAERKKREKEQRRIEILNATKKLLKKHGLEKTTMQMIADKVELAKGTLYLYFKEKNEIIFHILADANVALFRLMEKAAKKGKTGFEKIQLLAMAYMDFNQNHEESIYFKLVGHALPLTTYNHGRDNLKKRMERVHNTIKGVLDMGIADGSVRKDVNSNLSAFVLIKLGIATLTQRVFFDDPDIDTHSNYTVEDLNKNLFDLIIYSLRNTK